MMVLRLNTLMVLAVAADECMCQLFPVRGGDGQLKFAANDDGSCVAEKLFRAPRLEAGEELIVGDTNVMDRVESITAKALQTREQLDARDAELEQALQDTLEYLEAKSLGLQTNLTQTQEQKAQSLLEEIQRIESQEVSDAATFRTSIEGLSESLDAHKVASDEKLESVSLAVRESAEATQTYLEEAISEWDVKFEEERERAATVATEHANALDAKITEVETVRAQAEAKQQDILRERQAVVDAQFVEVSTLIEANKIIAAEDLQAATQAMKDQLEALEATRQEREAAKEAARAEADAVRKQEVDAAIAAADETNKEQDAMLETVKTDVEARFQQAEEARVAREAETEKATTARNEEVDGHLQQLRDDADERMTALDARLTERDGKVDAALAETETKHTATREKLAVIDTRHEEFVGATQEQFAKAEASQLEDKVELLEAAAQHDTRVLLRGAFDLRRLRRRRAHLHAIDATRSVHVGARRSSMNGSPKPSRSASRICRRPRRPEKRSKPRSRSGSPLRTRNMPRRSTRSSRNWKRFAREIYKTRKRSDASLPKPLSSASAPSTQSRLRRKQLMMSSRSVWLTSRPSLY